MAAKKESAPFAFPKEALTFFRGLEKDNSKAWFDAHRKDYDQNVLEPLKFMVMALGARLGGKKLPGLNADPRVNGSIFRINRDTRFSKDKSPYKTHAGAYLWLGGREKLRASGLYFQMDARQVLIGCGIYLMQEPELSAYRRNVAEKMGGKLSVALKKAVDAGFTAGGEALKKVPGGFDPNHKHAALLKQKGFFVTREYPAAMATKGDLIAFLAKEFTPALDFVKVMHAATM
ncbi:MAG: DUF2461 domain-containing protein [Nitrospinae bacterium]|nr:DUF2461 domain-containing protein [Nitrospinota bacterium]